MGRQRLILEPLTRSVIGGFYEVYNTLGFGFLEHVYKGALERELLARGHEVQREVGIIVRYKGEQIAVQRFDMIVDEKLLVEAKATIDLHGGAQRQVYNYLRASGLEVGLLLHFGLEPKFYRIADIHARQATQPRVDADAPENPDASDLLRNREASVPVDATQTKAYADASEHSNRPDRSVSGEDASHNEPA
ncbi:MAG TPA: GxxExxY protein [Gemmatimonadaceae bacterium]|jgi:GxxExxY protein